jgi:hypothetical protein
MVEQAQVTQLKNAQAGILAMIGRDLQAFIDSLDLLKPEQARDAIFEYWPLIVAQYGEAGAAAAADWYDDVRADQGVRGSFRARVAEPVAAEVVEASVRFSAAHLFTATPGLIVPSLLDSGSKQVLLPARRTIIESTRRDPRAGGWRRVTRAGSCKFCRFLAQRGAVYVKDVDFASHGNCNCASVPSWDPDAPEVDVRAYEASSRVGGLRKAAAAGDRKAARRLEAHTAKVRMYLEAYYDD